MAWLLISDQGGFSLIELILVLAISSIMMVLSSSLLPKGEATFSVENEKLRDVLSRARNKAVLKGACVAVEVKASEIETRTYFVSGPCTGPLGAPAEVAIESFSPVVALNSSPASELVFNKQGGTNRSLPFLVSMTTEEKRVRYLVYPATGQLELQ